MIHSATSPLAIPGSAVSARSTRARRRISPQAGHALEILGHAIEYLTDEFAREDLLPSAERGARFQAIELLMAVNRQVYFSCPEIPTLRARLAAFLHQLL